MNKKFSLERPSVFLFNKKLKKNYHCNLIVEMKYDNFEDELLYDLFSIHIQDKSDSIVKPDSKGVFFIDSDTFKKFPFSAELKFNSDNWEHVKKFRDANTKSISITLFVQSVEGGKKNKVCEWSASQIKKSVISVFKKFYDHDEFKVTLLIDGFKKESIPILDRDQKIDFEFDIKSFDPRMEKYLFDESNISASSPLVETEINNESLIKSYSISKEQQRNNNFELSLNLSKSGLWENDKSSMIWPFTIPDGFILITAEKKDFRIASPPLPLDKITIKYRNEKGFPTVSSPFKKLYIAKYNASNECWEFPSKDDLEIISDSDVVNNFYKLQIHKNSTKAEKISSYLELKFECEFMSTHYDPIPESFTIKVYEKTITVILENLNCVYLSIDLGTSAICVSTLDMGKEINKRGGKLKLQTFTDSNTKIDAIEADDFLHPTIVFFDIDKGGKIKFNKEVPLAIAQVSKKGSKGLPNIKMLMQKKYLLIGENREMSNDVVSKVFKILLQKILAVVLDSLKGKVVKHIIFSHPNTFNNQYRDIYESGIKSVKDIVSPTKECGSEIVSESESTLMCHIVNNILFADDDTTTDNATNSIVVLDIGAGTTDITFANITHENKKIIADIKSSLCFVAGGNFYDFLLAEAFFVMLSNLIVDKKITNDKVDKNRFIAPSEFIGIFEDNRKEGNQKSEEAIQSNNDRLETQKRLKKMITQLKKKFSEIMNHEQEDSLDDSLEAAGLTELNRSIKVFLEGANLIYIKDNHMKDLWVALANIKDTEISSALGTLKLSEQIKEATVGQIKNILDFTNSEHKDKRPLTIVVSGRASRFKLVQDALAKDQLSFNEKYNIEAKNIYNTDNGVAAEKYCVAEGAPFIALYKEKNDTLNISSTYQLPKLYAYFEPTYSGHSSSKNKIFEIKKLKLGENDSIGNGHGQLTLLTTFDAKKYEEKEHSIGDIKLSPYFQDSEMLEVKNSIKIRVDEKGRELRVYLNGDKNPIVFSDETKNNQDTLHKRLFDESMWPDSY